jgi:hypothetical protein
MDQGLKMNDKTESNQNNIDLIILFEKKIEGHPD